jgi:4-hydroxy-3-polyprenylbenzoate decarboxylase
MEQTKPTRLIVGITGATGTVFGVRLLQMLHGSGVETHLVLSKWAARTLVHETTHTVKEVQELATHSYGVSDQGAAISSGSFVTLGMVIAPCSMRTLAAIAHGLGDNLIHRAADVILKERRKLVLVVRESPFNEIHLENMLKLARHLYSWNGDSSYFDYYERGLLNNTCIIITSDHGGHDTTHGYNIPEDMIIPWIISGPRTEWLGADADAG